MSPQRPPQRNNSPAAPQQLDAETVKLLLHQQSQKLALEMKRVELEEKRINSNEKLAEKSMEMNAGLLKNAPTEHRKTAQTYAIIGIIILLILLAFVVVLLWLDKQTFLIGLLKGLKDFALAFAGFFIGRKSVAKKKKGAESSEPEDAEEVTD